MATKNNPGAFDCYYNAHPDEPMFVLLGRDRHAAGLVRLWALLRHREWERGGNVDCDKIEEALKCADAMDAWVQSLGKNPVENDAVFDPLFLAATDDMTEHPEGFDRTCNCDECCTYQ